MCRYLYAICHDVINTMSNNFIDSVCVCYKIKIGTNMDF